MHECARSRRRMLENDSHCAIMVRFGTAGTSPTTAAFASDYHRDRATSISKPVMLASWERGAHGAGIRSGWFA